MSLNIVGNTKLSFSVSLKCTFIITAKLSAMALQIILYTVSPHTNDYLLYAPTYTTLNRKLPIFNSLKRVGIDPHFLSKQ